MFGIRLSSDQAATAQVHSEDPGSAGRYCDIVVEKVAPESAASRVTSKVCGDAPAIGARKDVLLMEWFEHANNNPPSLTRIHGGADCDASGYRIPISGFWDNRVSGFITYSLCDFIIAYDGLYEGDAQQYTDRRQPFVGSKMNDRISSFRICRSVPCVG